MHEFVLALLVGGGVEAVVESGVNLRVAVYRRRANTGKKAAIQYIVSVQCTICMHDQVVQCKRALSMLKSC